MTDEMQAYDSLDAFCAEYGFDAATMQRMRDDMLAIAPAQEGSSHKEEKARKDAERVAQVEADAALKRDQKRRAQGAAEI